MKLLLKKMLPHVLAKRMNGGDDLGCVYLMDVDPSEGLVWKTLTNSRKMKIVSLKIEDIDSMTVCSLFKVSMCHYL